ncbi:hypothetical protein AWC38_SpisGene12675 [Stylophora pistillata]|uniref:Uncharacterized protein n=1 Tax=Stylophora pistillata TaxID=50429 RepID=A0A2B4S1Y0_STYPI|nr:hypothetical protein AWC38_SpisGene12675 [Stylophora pistillata]
MGCTVKMAVLALNIVCIFFISDPQNPEFQGSCSHEHQARCDSCESLKSVIKAIGSETESPLITFDSIGKKEDLKHDHSEAREAILQGKARINRTKNQERAKQNLLMSLGKNTSLIVMDSAMKFNHLKYREKQSEWFGKRVINWRVSSVIMRNAEDNDLEIMSYVHFFESCAQDWKKSRFRASCAGMRMAREADGTRKFTRNEWLTNSQVQSFFSKLSALKRRKATVPKDPEKDANDDDNHDDDDDDDESLIEEDSGYLEHEARKKDVADVTS